VAERLRLVERVAIDREVRGEADPAVRPRRLRVPLIDEDEPLAAGDDGGLQGEARRPLKLLGQRTSDRVDDVGFAPLQHGQARGFIGHGLEDEARGAVNTFRRTLRSDRSS
jgi:hypothetical protein